jgi:hypothetical protein
MSQKTGAAPVQRRDDDLVVRAAAHGQQRQVKGRRAVRDGDRVRGAAEGREVRLELLDSRPHAPPAGAHHPEHGVDELVVDEDVAEWNPPAALGLGHRRSFTEVL